MGVLGLWDVLESVGHPVKVEGLEGKVLGVDANIWLYKFIRGFREKDNATNIDSHKLGLFNRLAKLLFYRIKPVFVFDGPAPVLKRRTLERRQNTRNKHLSKVQDAALKALATQLKSQYPNADIDQLKITLPELRSNNLVAAEKLGEEDFDLFYLPPEADMKRKRNGDDDDEDDQESDSSDGLEGNIQCSAKVDVESKDFEQLPPEVRYEILHDIKESRRRIRNAEALPDDAGSFSSFQLERLNARRKIQEKIEKCEKDICTNYTGELADGTSIQAFRVQSDATSTILYRNNTYDPKALEKIKNEAQKERDELKPKSLDFEKSESFNLKSEDSVKSLSLIDTSDTHNQKQYDEILVESDLDTSSESSGRGAPNSTIDLCTTINTTTTPKSREDSPILEELLSDDESSSGSSCELLEHIYSSKDERGEVQEDDKQVQAKNDGELLAENDEEVPAKNDEEVPANNDEEVLAKDDEEVPAKDDEEEVEKNDKEDSEKDKKEETEKNSGRNQVYEILSSSDESTDVDIDFEPISKSQPMPEERKIGPDKRGSLSQDFNVGQSSHSARVFVQDHIPARIIERSHINEQSEHIMNAQRSTNKVTGKIIDDAKELLRLFGVPYIDATGEAEAQCAKLEELKLTAGTITDDSDIWLFGSQNVYRYFFSDDKYVMQYKMTDIEYHIRMTRENLVCFAMLVGSDYTDGIMNVGPVTALEILSEFPGEGIEPLVKFKEWHQVALKDKTKIGDKKRKKLLKFKLPEEFPSRAVYDGYLRPFADSSTEAFSWGTPELDELREYARRNFGWDQKKIDEKLLPVMKKLSEKKIQKTIDTFFFKTQANRNPEMFRSKRVNQALNKIAKRAALEDKADVVNLSEDDDDDS